MINKYRKKPVVVEAIQFTGTDENLDLMKDFTGGKSEAWKRHNTAIRLMDLVCDKLTIPTLEGPMTANIGDFIIKEPYDMERGFYPCKPDVFNKTYSEVIKNESS